MPRLSRRVVLGGGLTGLFSAGLPGIAIGAETPAPNPLVPADISWRVDGFPEIDAMAPLIRRVLGAVATSFPGHLGQVYGFDAGALYPAIFARDFATVAEFAAHLFAPDFLRTPVEELLLTQEFLAADPPFRGAVAATISAGGEVDKATVVSDEETSLIHAAYVHFRATGGAAWLTSLISGKSIITRLNEAMSYLQRQRRDADTGLIWRAHTTDWGDVKLEGGSNPTDFTPGDAVIAGIFDQALTYRALLELQQMNAAAGDQGASFFYGDTARILRDAANLHLWDAVRGRYRIHKNLSPVSIPVDTDNIFTLGNHIAVDTGLASDEQALQIFSNTLNTAFQSGINRPGLTLWPPYPTGVFDHPNMESGEYQNGGVWDWWAGPQVIGEFTRGGSAIAFDHLLATARHWQRTGQITEWFHYATNSDQGSLDFGGAAAAMGLAVTRGLFGVEITSDGYTVNSHLAPHTGAIDLTHQPTGTSLSVNQTGGADWVAATVNSNATGSVSLNVPYSWENVLTLLDDVPAGAGVLRRLNDSASLPLAVPTGAHVVAILRAATNDITAAWDTSYAGFHDLAAGSGFWVSNSAAIGMWASYRALGGRDRLGPAVSGRFVLDGLIAQAAQKFVLQWEPTLGRAVIAPIFSLLSAAGLDGWLQATNGIPLPESGGPRMTLVDNDAAIRDVFFAEPDWGGFYGLPVAWSQDATVSILRTERAVFQHWKVDTPWAPAGVVTIANSGSIAAAAGLIPTAAIAYVPGLPVLPLPPSV